MHQPAPVLGLTVTICPSAGDGGGGGGGSGSDGGGGGGASGSYPLRLCAASHILDDLLRMECTYI